MNADQQMEFMMSLKTLLDPILPIEIDSPPPMMWGPFNSGKSKIDNLINRIFDDFDKLSPNPENKFNNIRNFG